MDKNELEAIVREAVRDADLRPEEIPAIDLYLDQITSLMAEKLKEGSSRYEDRILTKTMINNYSKDGLISPVKGKKYSRDQILQMLLVYSMKNTLSIGEIGRVLQGIYALPSYSVTMLTDTYNRFLEVKAYEREVTAPMIEKFVDKMGLDLESDADFFTLILSLASFSAYIKSTVQALLEAHYPDPDAERAREEQARREDAKRQKEERKNAGKDEKSRSKDKAKDSGNKKTKKKTAAADADADASEAEPANAPNGDPNAQKETDEA
jgi:hypothetical protein